MRGVTNQIRFRGRLVEVKSQFDYSDTRIVTVVKGKPLDLSKKGSKDYKRLMELFWRNRKAKREIREYEEYRERYLNG